MSDVSDQICRMISGDGKTPCRLCLRCQPRITDASHNHLRVIIHTLFSFWVESDDKYKVICVECLNTVSSFYSFYKKVLSIQKEFAESIIDKNDTNIADDSTSVCEIKPANEVKVEPVDFENSDAEVDSEIPFDPITPKEECMSSDEIEDLQKPNVSNSDNDLCDSKNSPLNLSEDNYRHDKHVTSTTTQESGLVSNPKNPDCKFPTELVRNGRLLFKGQTLDNYINKFYDLGCEICKPKVQFTELKDLFNHYKLEHKTRGYVHCCNSKLFNKTPISMHMARHLQPAAFECHICKMSVARPGTLKLHIQTHFPHSEKLFQCDQCDKGFGSHSILKRHKEQHSESPLVSRYCEICDKSFKNSASLNVHKSNEHKNNLQFLCSECGKKFKTNCNYLRHLETHDPSGKNRVPCDQCNFVSKNKASLRYHMMQHNGKRYSCDLCDFTTIKKFYVKRHIEVKHTDNKPYACIVCSKRFKINKNLRDHMSQHTGEYRSCPYCPKKFLSPGNCYSHKRRMHGDLLEKELLKKDLERVQYVEKCKPDMTKRKEIETFIQERTREELEKFKSGHSNLNPQ
ncbi:uncharacterized protein LOC143917934 [Arctopsyche grandis]|uniref:uncharacterized protein LOC143917934 n=1 Tax=Arctopsyche grandis TaxID=121162 RepID=UPI00406D677B